MDLLLAFIVFIAVMMLCLWQGITVVLALAVGFVAFACVGIHRGYKLQDILKMSWQGAYDARIVIVIMALIGCITASWRVSGTITIFVYYGMKLIQPHLFVIIAFLMSTLMSYALGSSFGVTGTLGVIFMAIARSGDANLMVTAGAILSGAVFGDRSSPMSSAANLAAAITDSKIYDNVKLMVKGVVPPLLLATLLYAICSYLYPIRSVDEVIVRQFEEAFNLSPIAFLPAILILLLPAFKIDLTKAMVASLATAILIAVFVQGVPVGQTLLYCIAGYTSPSEGLGAILNGGGLRSMAEVLVILVISCGYSRIFTETHMLDAVQDKITSISRKIGRFNVLMLLSFATCGLFCNQTIATLMCNALRGKPYRDMGADGTELAVDMGNSTLVSVFLVPWTIGAIVPLQFLGVTFAGAMPYAFLVYLIPLYFLVVNEIKRRRALGKGEL